MSSNVYIIIAIFSILILSLITILYNTYAFKKDIEGVRQIEMFQNMDFKPTHPVVYPQPDAYKEDDSQPLKKYRYIKRSAIQNLENDLPELFYTTYTQFYSMSVNDIHQKIADDLNKMAMKTSEEFIQGPVYAIVNTDVTDIGKDIYSDDIVDVGTKEELTTIFIIYPRYHSDDNGKIIANKQGMSQFKSYFDTIITTDLLGDLAIVYQLNKQNKLFHNLAS